MDKTAFVTGGAAGMGRALCNALASRGARVVIADIKGEEAERAASELISKGFTACAITLDVTSEDAVFRAVDETVSRFGSLDYYINNAGIGISADARDLNMGQWRRVFDGFRLVRHRWKHADYRRVIYQHER